jgi:hypothetical protein
MPGKGGKVVSGKEEFQKHSPRLISRKRYRVLEGKGVSQFNLYQPLNLSEEEYNRFKEEIKKRGNMG